MMMRIAGFLAALVAVFLLSNAVQAQSYLGPAPVITDGTTGLSAATAYNGIFTVHTHGNFNAVVGHINQLSSDSTGAFPAGTTGVCEMGLTGGTCYGIAAVVNQNAFGVSGNELDCRNNIAAPTTGLPPSRSTASDAQPICLLIAAGGTFQSLIALQIAQDGCFSCSPNSFQYGIYTNPNSITNYGIWIGASASSGPQIAGRFDIRGTGSDVGLYVGIFGTTSTALEIVNGLPSSPTQRFVVNSNGDITVAGGGWTAYTPTGSCFSGALGVATLTGRFKQIGKTTFISVAVNVPNNGTCAGTLNFTLPATANFAATLVGREISQTGKDVSCSIGSGSTMASCQNYDNSYPIVAGVTNNLVLTGTYEAQ